jgi:hypothetical protein
MGIYPAYNVDGDDRFKATIGCNQSNPHCSVTFQLDYIVSGSTALNTFATWNQTGTNGFTSVNLGLVSLKDKSIQFVLVVINQNGGANQDEAFWGQPEIVED